MNIVIRIAGTDVTDDVEFADATFTTSVGAYPGDFEIKIKDRPQTYSFETGNVITLDVDGVRVFDGFLMQISREFAFPVEDSVTRAPVLFWHLRGPDVNILFQHRIVFDQDHPERRIPDFPVGTTDLTALNSLVSDYLDLSSDGLTTDFNQVGVIAPDEKALPFNVGDTWLTGMFNISQLPGAVWGIKPNRTFYYEDDGTENAPFRLSDHPNQSTSFGYSDLAWLDDGTRLANDAPAWGAGLGSTKIVYARVQDSPSISEHGRWQQARLYRGDVYRQTTITKVSNSIVYGSPQNLHGGKDDAVRITCRVRKPGLAPGDKVRLESQVHGISGVYPIRQMVITTPTPTDALFDLTLTYDIDRPYRYFNRFPFPSIPSTGGGTVDDQCLEGQPSDCGITDTYTRSVAGGWGTSDSGYVWGGISGSGPLTADTYVDGSYGYIGVPGGNTTGLLGTQMSISQPSDELPYSSEIEIYFEVMGFDFSAPPVPVGREPGQYQQAFLVEINQSAPEPNLTQLFMDFASGAGPFLGLWRYNNDSTTSSDFEYDEIVPYGWATGTVYKVRVLATREHSYARIWAGDAEPSTWTIVSNVNFDNPGIAPSPLTDGGSQPQRLRLVLQSFQLLSSPFGTVSQARHARVDNVSIFLDGLLLNSCYPDSVGPVDSGSAILARATGSATWDYNASGSPTLLPPPPALRFPGGGNVPVTTTYTAGVPSVTAASGGLLMSLYGGGNSPSFGEIADVRLDVIAPSLEFTVTYTLFISEPSDFIGGSGLVSAIVFLLPTPLASSGIYFEVYKATPSTPTRLYQGIPGFTVPHTNGVLVGDTGDSPMVFGTSVFSFADDTIETTLYGLWGSHTWTRTNAFASTMPSPPQTFSAVLRGSFGATAAGENFRGADFALNIDSITWRNVSDCGAIGGHLQVGSIKAGQFICETPIRAGRRFTISYPYLAGSLDVYLNGTRQRNNVDYTETGSHQFTFVNALPTDATVYACYITGAT